MYSEERRRYLVELDFAGVERGLRKVGKSLLQADQKRFSSLGEVRFSGCPSSPDVDRRLNSIRDLENLMLRRQIQAIEQAFRRELIGSDKAIQQIA